MNYLGRSQLSTASILFPVCVFLLSLALEYAGYTDVVMRPCKALRPSSARLTYSQHRTIPCYSRRWLADWHSSPAKPHTIPDKPSSSSSDTQLSSDRDDVFKIDPENKTIKTAVGALPLSPIMDPSFWEATRRHQVPKAKAGKPQNSVERQLRANPFGKGQSQNVSPAS